MSNTSESNPTLISASEIKPARAQSDLKTVAEVREKLAGATGPKYWRTLEELTGKHEAAFGELLEREFPRQHSEWIDPVSRRNFLKLAGASMALAGLAGCTKQPLEQILPYVRQPEELVPGKPIYYATAMPFAGYAHPLLVETHEFRPTKIEGNKDHPASLGATDLFAQASIYNLYDPDRTNVVTHMGEVAPYGKFVIEMQKRIGYHKGNGGAGLRFLTGAVCSPTLGSQMKAVQQLFPQAKWHRWDPVHRDAVRAGSKLAFGAYYDPQYKFDAADVVVSLDADFLSGVWFPGFVKYAREFMSRRKAADEKMNRLYVAESSPTTTGAKADNKLVARQSDIEKIARALAGKLGVSADAGGALSPEQKKWVDAVVADLSANRGRSLVVPGVFQSPTVNALAHAINAQLGNSGKTVTYIDPVEIDAVEHVQSIRELVDDINAGKVETLIILGGNPVYNAPADVKFESAIHDLLTNAHKSEAGSFIAHLSNFYNETSEYAQWHVPEAHYLEAWSDARAVDGIVTIVQPMIQPLYNGKSAHEILAIFHDQPAASGHELLQDHWRSQHTGADFEQWWRKSVHDGYVNGSGFPARNVTAKLGALPESGAATMLASGQVVEVMFRPDPTIYDGSFINNGWLQETPKPLSRTTWDNVAMISPAMADRLGLMNLDQYKGDHQSDSQRVIEVEFQGRKVKAPYWPQPGHPDQAITLFFGYGQKKAGRVGRDDNGGARGYDAYSVRPLAAQYGGPGSVVVTSEQYDIAVTQGHFNMEDREPVKVATLEEFLKDPNFAHKNKAEEPQDNNSGKGPEESLYPNFRNSDAGFYRDYAWGMAIDLNSCVGCQACAVACQAENNISVVGKAQVQVGREMQWIRIDAYYEGDAANPNVYFQPVPCMQCENAPCEPVCPVGATTHSTEGLNDMVYNRCVGTRYCSNNCPYKVRRFNFLLFADFETPSLKMMRNPDVSVRSRGVMEKCTYCVQRINAARIAAEKADVKIQDSYNKDSKISIVTACEQVCPTGAIVFGNINDPESRVAKLKAEKRNYQLLAELNTRPRTTYIAAVRNPNKELKSQENAKA